MRLLMATLLILAFDVTALAESLDSTVVGIDAEWVTSKDMSSIKTRKLPIPRLEQGLLVASISEDGPVGFLSLNDIIVAFNGESLPASREEAMQVIANAPAGVHDISVLRISKTQSGRGVWKKETVKVPFVTARETALSMLQRQRDEFEDVDRFTHKDLPQSALSKTGIVPYILVKDGKTIPVIRLQVEETGWLFVESAVVLIDDSKHRISGDDFEFKREVVSADSLHEWCVIRGDAVTPIWEDLKAAKTASIRFYGKDVYRDFACNKKTIQALNYITSRLDELPKLLSGPDRRE